jgi:hypothetical protein
MSRISCKSCKVVACLGQSQSSSLLHVAYIACCMHVACMMTSWMHACQMHVEFVRMHVQSRSSYMPCIAKSQGRVVILTEVSSQVLNSN